MSQNRRQTDLPLKRFYARITQSGIIAIALIAISLAIGMAGYHWLEGLAWLDAFLNASMLLGGMGPVDNPATEGGKLFAGLYALYCGLVVIAVTGLLLAPVAHLVLHKFHLEKQQADKE